MFKKIYVEITNHCNLNCPFCSSSEKNTANLTKEEFEHILREIKPYTNEISLHILGEPLVHPNIVKFLNIANDMDLNINLTTNGLLLNKVPQILNTKQKKINISLNSLLKFDQDTLKLYMDDIFKFIQEKKEKDDDVVINLRLWAYDKFNLANIIKLIENYFNINITNYDKIRLRKKVVLVFDKHFNWPDIKSDLSIEQKYCLGGQSHIGIRCDGTVVICCLDASGASNLGNIFNESLSNILNTSKFKNTVKNFKDNKTYLDICKKCNFDHKRK